MASCEGRRRWRGARAGEAKAGSVSAAGGWAARDAGVCATASSNAASFANDGGVLGCGAPAAGSGADVIMDGDADVDVDADADVDVGAPASMPSAPSSYSMPNSSASIFEPALGSGRRATASSCAREWRAEGPSSSIWAMDCAREAAARREVADLLRLRERLWREGERRGAEEVEAERKREDGPVSAPS